MKQSNSSKANRQQIRSQDSTRPKAFFSPPKSPQIKTNGTQKISNLKKIVDQEKKLRKNSTEAAFQDLDPSKSERLKKIIIQQKVNEFLRESNQIALDKLLHLKYLVLIYIIIYKFHVNKGNNSETVKQILRKRSWLIETPQTNNIHFIWKPTSKNFPFDSNKTTLFNHIKIHRELTTKQRLYLNLERFCEEKNIALSTIVPFTFILNLDNPNLEKQINEFVSIFSKQTMRNCWLLKPPDLNRGQGIKIFNKIDSFVKTLNAVYQQKSNKISSRPHVQKIIHLSAKNEVYALQQKGGKQRQVVLQKYLESPLLYNGRKFDFRVWVLIDHNFAFFFFKEGYLRLASEQYDLSSQESLSNHYIHLTNNAVQKNHQKYQKFELGNQLSFADLQGYFDQKGHDLDVGGNIVSQMKQIVKYSMSSIQNKVSRQSIQPNLHFEILGYDFMIDNHGHLWLIEINTNPCLELSSPLLQTLIPRMLTYPKDDAFRITVDKMCNPMPNSKDRLIQNEVYDFLSDFHVPGYSDKDNLWEFLGRLV